MPRRVSPTDAVEAVLNLWLPQREPDKADS
jgi:hypothetical protein